jgi:lambda family phage portal protein
MKLSALERGLASLSPAWGARRLGERMALAEMEGLAAKIEARRYDSARLDRRTMGWHATGGSPTAEIAQGLGLTIRRSRDLCRNNEWARNARRKWIGHAVGTGIVPRADTKAKTAKKTATNAWNDFADNCDPEGLSDFYGLQARVVGEVFSGGACFVRWYLRPPSWGLTVPLQCEVLPHEFLDRTRNFLNGQNMVLQGVEYDQFGRRVAYYLFREHPGELLPFARASLVSDRVPASDVDHIFFVEEAGQVTGMPWLAATALRLRDIADRDEAALVREKIAACLSVIVRRQGGVANSLGGQAGKDAKTGQPIEKLSPGSFAYVESDGDVTVVNPPAAGDTDFVNRNLYPVAAGVGLPHSSVSGNLSNVNFTSLREGKLDFFPSLDQVQWFMLAPMLLRPAWRRVMAAAAGRGIQVSPSLGAKWSMPKRPWVNPVDDMKGEAGELAMALESWAEKVAARGHDPDDLIEEIKEWREKLLAAGIDPNAASGIAGDRLQDPNATKGQTPANAPAK